MIKITATKDKVVLGHFYIPDGADKEWVEKNITPIILAIQLLAGEIKETGY